MKLCTKNDLLQMIEKGELVIKGVENINDNFIDDIRFGLKISQDIFLLEKQEMDIEKKMDYKKLNIYEKGIKANNFYLAKSIEKFSLPNNLCGFLFTRSKYARKGFELLKSSNFIIPGFGMSSPCEIIYEILSPIDIINFSSQKRYGFILFYKLEEPINIVDKKNITKLPNGIL